MRGYFGIGIYMPKTETNIGTLWRSAYQLGAGFIFTIGRRYKKQCSDTTKAFKHIPLWNFDSIKDLNTIYDCKIIYVDFGKNSISLERFIHPERCIYLLGAEDFGFPEHIKENKQLLSIPTIRLESFNVSVAGSIIMYDRLLKIKESK